jgi:enoyl-CoA hydratase
VGIGRAKELLFTGRMVDAEEALRIGFVNKVVPPDALDDEARRLAIKIGGNSLSSLRAIKMLVNFGLSEGYEVGLLQEVTAFSEAFNADTKQWERLWTTGTV